MSRTGRATVMTGERFEVREYPVPEPEPGTVLLKQELAGICGTDLHNWEYQRLCGCLWGALRHPNHCGGALGRRCQGQAYSGYSLWSSDPFGGRFL